MASKTLTRPVVTEQQMIQNDNQQAEYDAMVQQSMTALQNQEQMEQEAYATGNIVGLYDVYDGSVNMESMTVEQSLPDIDPTVTEQQALSGGKSQFSNVFSKLFGTLANVFGKDSAIGSKLQELAEQLDDTYSQDASAIQQETIDELNGTTQADTAEAGVADAQSNADVYVPTAAEQQVRQEVLDFSNQNMRESAQLVAVNDEFIDMADAKDKDFTYMNSSMNVMRLRLGEKAMASLSAVDVNAKDKSDVANDYMTMVRGLKTYNDTALTEIETKYQDDPEKLEKAKQGLGNMMSRAGNYAYNIVGNANKQYDFLSEQDKAEVDVLQLQGLDKTYSEYVGENKLEPQQKEDMQMYADVEQTDMGGELTEFSESSKSDMKFLGVTKGMQSVESRTAVQNANKSVVSTLGQSRGQMAENVFDTVLKNEEQAKQSSLTAGLER